jgi:hypothetical protein
VSGSSRENPSSNTRASNVVGEMKVTGIRGTWTRRSTCRSSGLTTSWSRLRDTTHPRDVFRTKYHASIVWTYISINTCAHTWTTEASLGDAQPRLYTLYIYIYMWVCGVLLKDAVLSPAQCWRHDDVVILKINFLIARTDSPDEGYYGHLTLGYGSFRDDSPRTWTLWRTHLAEEVGRVFNQCVC